MLDRTIPFYNTILRGDQLLTQNICLPDGYAFASYRDESAFAWAKLEFAAGDFDTLAEAQRYFEHNYLSDKAALMRRGVFVTDSCGAVVGSCLAWTDLRGEEPVSSLHWLIVSPEHQGRGIGRAVTEETLRRFDKLPIYIHTQPWSWKAILLYLSLGFRLQKSDTFSHYHNEYAQAMETLRAVVSPEQYRMMEAMSDD
jgi:ribosomal protein S18 acetylase RimI-like enzyme